MLPRSGGTLIDRLYREFRRVKVWELDEFFATYGSLWLDDAAANGTPYEETTHTVEQYEAFEAYKHIVSTTLEAFATSPRTALGGRPAGLGFRSLSDALAAVSAEADRCIDSSDASTQQERLEALLRDADSFESFVAMMRSKARSQRHLLLLLAEGGGGGGGGNRSRDSTRRATCDEEEASATSERRRTSPLRHERRDQSPSPIGGSARRRRGRSSLSPGGSSKLDEVTSSSKLDDDEPRRGRRSRASSTASSSKDGSDTDDSEHERRRVGGDDALAFAGLPLPSTLAADTSPLERRRPRSGLRFFSSPDAEDDGEGGGGG